MKTIQAIKRISRVIKFLLKNNKCAFIDLTFSNIYQGLIAFLKAEKTTRIGFVVTFLWLTFIILIGIFNEDNLYKLDLNEFGDFMAGAFAPLAFFWFVIGYFQQGKELQLQREELALQRKEFNFQGKQAQRQADATEKQVAIGERELEAGKKDVRPNLVYEKTTTASASRQIRYEVNFKNIGGPALNAEVSASDTNVIGYDLKPNRNIYPDGDTPYRITFRVTSSDQLPVSITLEYSDSEGRLYRHQAFLSIEKKENLKFFNSQKLINGQLKKK